MDLLRRRCSALIDHYLAAMLATFLGLGVPALLTRFVDKHLALVLGGLTVAVMVSVTLIAQLRWRRITSVWACDEADRHHAVVIDAPIHLRQTDQRGSRREQAAA